MSLSQVIPIRPNTRIEFALIHEANHRVANHLTLLAGMVQVQASNLAKGPEMVSRDDVQATRSPSGCSRGLATGAWSAESR